MKIQTSELIDLALDWAVAKCECALRNWPNYTVLPAYSTDWALGGPIIEREWIELKHIGDTFGWRAFLKLNQDPLIAYCGPTPLIAAMRCYVTSKLGNVIDVPEELMK